MGQVCSIYFYGHISPYIRNTAENDRVIRIVQRLLVIIFYHAYNGINLSPKVNFSTNCLLGFFKTHFLGSHFIENHCMRISAEIL